MVILLILNILSIFVCFFIAKKRSAKASFWGLMGALFGPLAIPFVFLAKPVSTPE